MTAKSRAVSPSGKTEPKSPRSEREEMEDTLREQQSMLATAEQIARMGSWKWDLRTQKVTWSDEMFRLFGVERKGFDGDVNRVVAERIHPDDAAAVAESNRKVLEERDPIPMSYRIVLPDGKERTVWAQGQLVRDEKGEVMALTGYVQDITEHVRAEKKLNQMKRLYATLSQVNQMIVRVKDRDELYQTICDVAIKFGEFSVAWIGVVDEGTGDVRPIAATGMDVKHWPLPIVNTHAGPLSDGLVSRAIKTSAVSTTTDAQADQHLQVLHRQLHDHDFHSSAVIPFRLRDKTIGSFALLSQEIGLFDDEAELRLLEEMGLDISFALNAMENERERRQAEEEVQIGKLKLETALASMTDAVFISDIEGRFIDFNEAFATFHKFRNKSECARTLAEYPEFLEVFMSNEELAPLEQWAVPRALRGETVANAEYFLRRKDTGESWVGSYSFAPIRDKDGVIAGSVVVGRDVTERKRTENRLRENEERLRLSLQAANQGLYDLNVQTGDAIVNKEYAEMLGYDVETFVETNAFWQERLHPNDRERVGKVYVDYIRGVLPEYRVEFRQRTRDGQWKWILSLGKVIERDAAGKPLRMLGTHTDITERKQMEEALKRSEHVLRLFVQHSPASIAMFDRDMKYIVASHRYLIDYRLGEQDLTGRSHYDVFPEIPDRWREIHRRCLQGGIEKADEDPFPREDGTLDWVRWEIRPWYEEGGRIGGIILFSEVITERKQVQDELRLLNLELEQRVRDRTLELSHANRAKDEFLANMSHELRTPLNTVLGLSESLLEQRRGPLNDKQVQSIELISSSGQHLLGLINDILEVSKIEAGKLELHPTTVAVKELCESSLNFIKEIALRKLIEVEFHNEFSVNTFYADPQRIKQILINLLTNAVKFTPVRGTVSLDVSTNDERDQILFSVTDTGIGIAAQDLNKLFTPFTQLDSSLARQYEGTGLGLALVRKLAELHGGGVRVESETGRGSRFTIALPIHQNNLEQISNKSLVESTSIAPRPSPLSTMSEESGVILLAEDNALNSEMLIEYLETQGYSIILAENGEEVLEKVETTTPDIVLMDIQMPKMDGLEATRRLRLDPRFAFTPIIALTALAMPGDKERCLAAGATEYLSKPVSLKKLLQLIQRLTKPES